MEVFRFVSRDGYLFTNINLRVCRCAVLQSWFKMKSTSIFPVHGLASLILMSKHAQSLQFFEEFPDNILQGWFKMKTTSIFPVHELASLILMSKYAQSRQFFVGVS